MTSTHKHHIISIQYPSHKCLPEKSCLDCLRILMMSWLFKDPAVIMKVIMSWLFKDPIDLAQFQSCPIKQQKMASRLKRSNCPKWNFFSKNNKIFIYLLAPFILQNLKRILRPDPELSGCAIFGHKIAHLSWTKFFDTNQYYYFHLLVGPFHCAKFTKNTYCQSKVVRMPHFWIQNGPFATNIFFGKIINSIFI